ncbi:MAG: fumarylacetoacetate hydrolase family protein, partial [Acetivibrionales bacterium]
TVTDPGGEVDICGHLVTYEGELGVIIGKRGKNITREEAYDYIAGYTIVNDMTANDCTKEDIQLLRGKNFDGFFPMGPYFVTKDEVANPMNLNIKTKVNGEIRQDSNTSNMIFNISEQIEYFSSFLTLEPGDVIATGTPAGTALQFNPPRFLKPKDKVEVIIEGLGSLLCQIKN